jgi:phosphoribosyl-ATP pyrophosphohydrolase
VSRFTDVFERLAAVIDSRRGADPASSWSARLIAAPQLAAEKLVEEAGETAEAAGHADADAVAAESADLIYHWLALLASQGVSLDAVAAKLEAREGTSGIAEKASRET